MRSLSRLAVLGLMLPACASSAREGFLHVWATHAKYGAPSQLMVVAAFRHATTEVAPRADELGCRSAADEYRRLEASLSVDTRSKPASAGTLLLTLPDGRTLHVDPFSPAIPTYATGLVPVAWAPGQEIRARFTGHDGGEIEAAVHLPPPLVVTWPECPAARPAPCATYDVWAACFKEFSPMTPRCPPLDRRRDVVVSWVPAPSGVVDVRFENEESRKGLANHCQFDARTGRGVIPSALVPPRGDIELTVGVREFVDARVGKNVLQVTVEAPKEERVFPEK